MFATWRLLLPEGKASMVIHNKNFWIVLVFLTGMPQNLQNKNSWCRKRRVRCPEISPSESFFSEVLSEREDILQISFW